MIIDNELIPFDESPKGCWSIFNEDAPIKFGRDGQFKLGRPLTLRTKQWKDVRSLLLKIFQFFKVHSESGLATCWQRLTQAEQISEIGCHYGRAQNFWVSLAKECMPSEKFQKFVRNSLPPAIQTRTPIRSLNFWRSSICQNYYLSVFRMLPSRDMIN